MTHNPRPIIEWLNELPELIRELVIADYIANQPYSDATYNKMSDAIMNYSWIKSNVDIEMIFAIYADAAYHEQNNIKLPR